MEEDEDRERPPLGVVPKMIWYEQRALELSRAIHDYIKSGRYEQPYWWACELTNLLRMRENHIEKEPETKESEGA